MRAIRWDTEERVGAPTRPNFNHGASSGVEREENHQLQPLANRGSTRAQERNSVSEGRERREAVIQLQEDPGVSERVGSMSQHSHLNKLIWRSKFRNIAT